MRKGWSREKFDVHALADELIDRVGLRAVADEKVDKLATGTARLVEVARALASKPKVLLLDEPSAGLNESETTALVDGRLYVMMVASDAAHRNRGYAEAVMRRSLERAQAATGIRRTVLHASPAGRPLYASMGYRVTGEFMMYMAGGAGH